MPVNATFVPCVGIGQFTSTPCGRNLDQGKKDRFIHPWSLRNVQPVKWNTGAFRMSSSNVENSKRGEFSKDIRPAVKDLLGRLKKCSIYFIGPMGSGKSVTAKYLAKQLGFRYLDTDELITLTAKNDIPTIFETSGEKAFRDLESAVLDQVQSFLGCCVATGGGIVLRKENWGKLHTGIVVWLNAPTDVLVRRLEGDTSRPLLAGAESLRDRIESIMKSRRKMYEQADVEVRISQDDAVDDVGAEVVRKLNNFIKENPPRLSKLYAANLPKSEGA